MKWSGPLPRLSFHRAVDPIDPFWGLLWSPRRLGFPDAILYLYLGRYTFSMWCTWPERSTP